MKESPSTAWLCKIGLFLLRRKNQESKGFLSKCPNASESISYFIQCNSPKSLASGRMVFVAMMFWAKVKHESDHHHKHNRLHTTNRHKKKLPLCHFHTQTILHWRCHGGMGPQNAVRDVCIELYIFIHIVLTYIWIMWIMNTSSSLLSRWP